MKGLPTTSFFTQRDCRREYDLKETLGKGAFGVVRLAVEKKSGDKYACKIVSKSDCKMHGMKIESEIAILEKVDHPNVIKMKAVFETRSHWFMVMDLVMGGELFDKLEKMGSFNEKVASRCVQLILRGTQYLHSVDVVHRDLKPENILCDFVDDRITSLKIMDFGLSALLQSSSARLRTACGTPLYIAPEVLDAKPYTTKIDIWAIGVITYMLLTGYYPFFSEDNNELFDLIATGTYGFPDYLFKDISSGAIAFIRRCLTVNPATRPTAEILLTDPWISDSDSLSARPLLGLSMRLGSLKESMKQGAKLELPDDVSRSYAQLIAKDDSSSDDLGTEALLFDDVELDNVNSESDSDAAADWDLFAKVATVHIYLEGQAINENRLNYCRVKTGVAKCLVSKSGVDLTVATYTKDQEFGQESLLFPSDHGSWPFVPACVVASSATVEVYEVPCEELEKMFKQDEDLHMRFLKRLCKNRALVVGSTRAILNKAVAEFKQSKSFKRLSGGSAADTPARKTIKGADVICEFDCSWKRTLEHAGKASVTSSFLFVTEQVLSFLKQQALGFHKIESLVEEPSHKTLICKLFAKKGLSKAFSEKEWKLIFNSQEDYDNYVPVIMNVYKEYLASDKEKRLKPSSEKDQTNEMTREDLEKLISISVCKTYKKDEVVIAEGTENRDLFVIRKGSCRVEVLAPEDDHPIVLATLQAPENFGEIGFLRGCLATATVRANENGTEISMIQGEPLMQMMDSSKSFQLRFYKEIATTLEIRFYATITDYQVKLF